MIVQYTLEVMVFYTSKERAMSWPFPWEIAQRSFITIPIIFSSLKCSRLWHSSHNCLQSSFQKIAVSQ
jgi:hypothetical protein